MFVLVKRSKKYILILAACLILFYSLTFASKPVNQGVAGVKVIKPRPKTIISATWGKGEGQFGKTDEASIPGPMSFSVNGNNIYILDQENKRVQLFSLNGKYVSNFPLKKATYVDIKAQGRYIYLLDAYVDFCVDVYTPEGKLVKALPISKSLETVTGFQVIRGNVLVESNHSNSTIIGSVKGLSVNRETKRHSYKGRFAQSGKSIKVRLNKSAFFTQDNKLDTFKSPDLKAILDVLVDLKSTYVLMGFGRETKDSITGRYLSVVKVTNGKTEWQMILPYKYYTDHFRKIDVYGGSIYQIQTTSKSLKLVKWK